VEVKPLTLTSARAPGGFAAWEADAIARRRAVAAASEARATLAALVETAANLPDMHVPAALAAGAEETLRFLRAAREAARDGRGASASAFARDARNVAESAFYHPEFNAEMYFPPEFSMAVYVPLFLPTAFPLLIGAMWDARHFLRRRRCAAAWRRGARTAEQAAKAKAA
jgi:phosphatidylinositol glycan class S